MARKILYSVIGVMIAAMAGFAGLMVFSVLRTTEPPEVLAHASGLYQSYEYGEDEFGAEYGDAQPVWLAVIHHPDGVHRISAGTIITYEHYNPQTSEHETRLEFAPPALQGLTQPELSLMFADWRVLSFSPYNVHLRQNPELSSRSFTISVHEGFIAVFYDDDKTHVKELTTRPASALPIQEQMRLLEGIRVTGNEELIRALEDFGS
ncbi:MAG: hypothetical protein FWB74_03215 [Defluviitaleaceae bacterium]|nr:hypothetical protein [Defluviitaleaceae bacterium]